jgi:hypothetical protein
MGCHELRFEIGGGDNWGWVCWLCGGRLDMAVLIQIQDTFKPMLVAFEKPELDIGYFVIRILPSWRVPGFKFL